MKSLPYLSALAVLAATGACLAVPDDGSEPMCQSSSDCDEANGEICADGVCWGDPPEGLYAARLGPPGNRGGLVPTEITKIDIEANGWFTTRLALEAPVMLGGTVTYGCPESPCPAIASTITVTRGSRIPGGPAFVATAHTTEASGEFSIPVPRAESDEEYAIVVTPDKANDDAINLDDAAPARLLLTPTDDVLDLGFRLGGPGGRTVTGAVREGAYGVPGASVVVRGRWFTDGPMTDISSTAITSATGAFVVHLATGTDAVAAIVVTPPDDLDVLRPVLTTDLDLGVGTQVLDIGTLSMPDLGTTQPLTIPITGTSMMGVVEPIANADVTIVAETLIPRLPTAILAHVEVTGKTGPNGTVLLRTLPDPDLHYELHVQPPPQSGAAQYATIYGEALAIGVGTTSIPEIHLASQVPVRGTLYDHDGRPADGVVVTVVPNATYAAGLSDSLQRKLAEAVATSETTNSNGEFAVFVDPSIATAAAVYDVSFEPPQHALLPSWQTQAITVDPVTGYDLGDFDLPEAAYVRSLVYGPDDELVEAAEVRLYEVPSAILPCEGAIPADDPACAQKAILRAQALTDSGGEVHLVLPDP